MKTKFKISKFSLKMISLLASIFIWVFVLNAEQVVVEKTISLDYILPDDKVFSKKAPKEFLLKIKGPRAFVRNYLENDKSVILNLTNQIKKNGPFTIQLDQVLLDLPLGLDIEKIIPTKIEIEVETKITKNLPISLSLQGHQASKIRFKKMRIEPEVISVSGPENILSQLEEIKTRPINYDGLFGLNSVPVDLDLPDERMKILTKSDVKLYFEFNLKGPNFILKNLPIQILSHNEGMFFDDRFATIELYIPEKFKLNKDISSRIQIVAEIPKDQRGKVEIPLKTILPKGFYQIRLIPNSIIVDLP